jgi:F-type H+-transporting ATPase subunit b
MQIDWGQIVTHIIGFLLVVGILKKYAWGHISGFVEKRRETIANSFAEIDKGKAEVEEQRAGLDREMEKIEETRRQKIAEAGQEADSLANDIKEEARREAMAAREKAKQDVAIELDKANEVLKDRMIEAVLTTTEKVLAEKLDREKHNKIIADFLARVKVN